MNAWENLVKATADYLPSKRSRTCLWLAIALAIAPFLLPESVIAEIHWTPKAQLWLLKSTVSLGLLLIGACVILFIEINSRLRDKTAAENAPIFDPVDGVYRDLKTGICYCPKCKTAPMGRIEIGWHCAPCGKTYMSDAHRKKLDEDRKAEDELVRAYNNNPRI